LPAREGGVDALKAVVGASLLIGRVPRVAPPGDSGRRPHGAASDRRVPRRRSADEVFLVAQDDAGNVGETIFGSSLHVAA